MKPKPNAFGRFVRFAVVGASGVAVNMAVLILLREGLAIPLAWAGLLAIEVSLLSNFALNNGWTWADRRDTPLVARLLKYHTAAGLTALSANWGLLLLLTELFHVDYRLANLAGIAAGMVLNFALNHVWTFRAAAAPNPAATSRSGGGGEWRRWPGADMSAGWRIALLSLLVGALGLRLAAMAAMPLVPEEAYYWMYSQHPSLSYFDHPPMVAWVIGGGTHLFGQTEWGVRAGGALLMLAASGLMYGFGRLWFGRAAALAAAVLLQVLPVYFGAGLIATMDSALVFFWLLGLLGVSLALREERVAGWYLAGFALGGAMLSKYTGVFLGVGALLAVVSHRPWRRHLRTVHPYAAALLALALFSPVLIWNAQHEWASFRFQSVDRFAETALHPGKTAVFVALQLAVATPLLLGGFAWLVWRNLRLPQRWRAPRWTLVWCFSLPLLGVMAYKSLRYDIHLNWTLPLYLVVFPAVTRLVLVLRRRRRSAGGRQSLWPWWRPVQATVVGCLVVNVLALGYVLAVQPRTGWISALGPWRALAKEVEKFEEQLERQTDQEPLIIAGGKYRLASVLAFYRTPLEHAERASDQTTSQWILRGPGLGFPYWAPADRWRERDCLLVGEGRGIQQLAVYFDQFEVLETFHPSGGKEYLIALGRGRHETDLSAAASSRH